MHKSRIRFTPYKHIVSVSDMSENDEGNKQAALALGKVSFLIYDNSLNIEKNLPFNILLVSEEGHRTISS